MIGVTTYGSGQTPSFLAPTPAFSFFEYAIQGQLVNFDVFESLGGGWHEYKQGRFDFYAPGWLSGYDDEDVEKTPVLARGVSYSVFGIGW